MKYLLTVILTLVLAAPASAQLQIDKAAMNSGIETALADHVAAIESGDLAAWTETMVDDTAAVYFLPDTDPLVGFAALKAHMADQFERWSDVTIAVTDLSVQMSPHQTRGTVTSQWHLTAFEGEDRIDLKVRNTFVLWKWVYGWRIHHIHQSKAD